MLKTSLKMLETLILRHPKKAFFVENFVGYYLYIQINAYDKYTFYLRQNLNLRHFIPPDKQNRAKKVFTVFSGFQLFFLLRLR